MAIVTYNLEIKVACWVYAYLFFAALFANIFNREPDFDKVEYWVSKVIKVVKK